jgi:hypothetical protein
MATNDDERNTKRLLGISAQGCFPSLPCIFVEQYLAQKCLTTIGHFCSKMFSAKTPRDNQMFLHREIGRKNLWWLSGIFA